MDIIRNKETLLKWITSCQTAQQLDLFATLVREFDPTRSQKNSEPFQSELIKLELLDTISEQRIILAGAGSTMRVTSHFLLVPDESDLVLS